MEYVYVIEDQMGGEEFAARRGIMTDQHEAVERARSIANGIATEMRMRREPGVKVEETNDEDDQPSYEWIVSSERSYHQVYATAVLLNWVS